MGRKSQTAKSVPPPAAAVNCRVMTVRSLHVAAAIAQGVLAARIAPTALPAHRAVRRALLARADTTKGSGFSGRFTLRVITGFS